MTVTQKVPRKEGSPTPSPVPFLVTKTVTLASGATVGPYTLYSGSYAVDSPYAAKYGVESGQYSDTFKDVKELGHTCEAMDTNSSS